MAPQSVARRVVRSWSGAGTGQTIYEADNGSQWSHDPHVYSGGDNQTVSPRAATLVGGMIFEGKVQ